MEEQLGFVADINSKPMEDGLNRIEERVESTARAVEKSGMSVDEYAKHMQGVLASFDRLTQAVDKNTAAQEKAMSAGKKAADSEKQGADKATDAIHQTDKATQELGSSLKKAGDEGSAGFGKLQKSAAGFFTLAAAKEFGQKVFEVRSEIQSLQTSFETLVGNKGQAEELFNSIKDFATHTTMQLKDLASAAQTMMSFNIPVEQIMENLKALGDVSMGDAQKFQSLSLAFSQMSATGKLMGQDLLQMINAGFNPLATMSEKTGKSISELKDEMSKGAISADMVRQAFIDATSEGGKFHGMLEAQSKTLAGAYSNLQGAISDMFNSIGEQSEGIMAGAINAATVLVQNYEKVGQILLGLVATYGTYKAAVMAVTAIQGLQTAGVGALTAAETVHYGWLVLCEKAQKLLNKTMLANPYVLVATLIAGVAAALWNMKSQQDLVNEAQDEYNRKKEEAIAKEEEHKRKIDELIKVAGDESLSTESRKMAMSELMKKYPSLFKNYDTEIAALKDIAYWKAKIAEIESGKSIQLAQNELLDVNRQINELEAKSRRIKQTTKNVYNHQTLQWEKQTVNVPSLTREEQAKLQQLKNQRSKLNKQMKQDADSNYLKDLTGVSNRDLQKQIKERENLLAQIKVMEQKNGGKKVGGKVQMGGVTGVYSKEDIQDQLTRLKWEQNRRADVIKNGSQNFVSEAQKAYNKEKKELDRLRSLSDPNKRRSSNKTIDVAGKTLKESELTAEELQEAIEKQKKVVEKQQKSLEGLTGKSLKASASAAAKAAKEEQKQAKEEAAQNVRQIQEERRYQEELAKIQIEAADARRDAELAAIEDDGERERAEQDEQHKRNIRQIEQQADEMKKAVYEHNKKVWENAHKDSPYELTEEGKAGWKGLQLSDDQQTIIKAQLDKENAEYERHLADRRKAEQDAMTAYLKDFGTAEEQRLAIAEEYDRKINEARTEGERNTLVAQKQQALQSHDLEQQRKTMDMESLFNNLGQMSLDKLQQAKEELRGMLSAQNLGMDDYKTIAEQIDKVEDAIVEKQKQKKGLLGALIPGETTVQRLKRQQAEAEEQVKTATEKVVELQQQLAGQKLGIFSLLSMGRANYTGDISAANRSAIMESARNAGFSKEKLEELEKAMDGLVVTTDNLNNANKNEEEAKKNVKKKADLLGEALKDVRGRVGEFAESLQTLNANIQALPALMDSLGLGNTGAGQAISSVASAANNAMGAMSDFSSGNYVGAAVKAIGAVKDVAGVFSPDNTAKMQKKIDELNGHSDALAMAMKSLQKAFEKSYGIDAMRNAEKQRQLLESQQRDAQMAMVYEARKHGAARSTLNASVNDNYDWQVAMAMVSQILDKNVRYSGDDFLQLSAAEMQKIIDYDNGELWNKILAEYRKEGGTGGRSDQLPDMLQSYVDNFADAFDELDEVLNERLTTTTLDNVFGDYKNYLYDLANGSEDVFDNIEKNWQAMINQMVIDNLIFGKVQEQLEQWYNDLASLQRDKNEGNISPEEYARRLDALKNTYTDIMKGSQQEIEDFKEWGIIKPIEEGTEEAKSAFDGLRDTFKNDLLDMESDAEKFKKNLQRTLYEDLIEKNVFDVPFTINGQTFDDFEAYSKDWNERYAAAVAEGDTAALDALINELVEAREITATAAESYREALKKLDEQFDTTFKDMGGSWVSVLMGMDSDADAWGKEIGRTMAQKIIEQMVMTSAIQPLLDNLQDEFNRAMGESSTWQEVLADEGLNAALAEIKAAYPELQKTVTAIMDKLNLKIEEQAKQGFSDLRGQITSVLLDSEGDWDKDMATFGKNMAETMMKQMLGAMIDSKYKERMNAISAEWAEALEAADPARIDAVKQQVMGLYAEIGNDSEIKQLTADIKALAEGVDDTTTPFDNLRSSYHSWLMDMTKDTKDFTEDLNKMLADAFVDEFVMGKAMDDIIEKYKGQFKSIRDDATLSKEERAKQMRALGGLIAEEAEGLKAETKEVLSWFGLSNNVEDQGAAMNMAEAATYDQFELYLGIATAQQINGEQQLSVQQQILSTLQSMSGITSPNGETVKEISSRMRTANEYLLSIRDSNKAILDTMTRKLDVINSNLTRIL